MISKQGQRKEKIKLESTPFPHLKQSLGIELWKAIARKVLSLIMNCPTAGKGHILLYKQKSR